MAEKAPINEIAIDNLTEIETESVSESETVPEEPTPVSRGPPGGGKLIREDADEVGPGSQETGDAGIERAFEAQLA